MDDPFKDLNGMGKEKEIRKEREILWSLVDSKNKLINKYPSKINICQSMIFRRKEVLKELENDYLQGKEISEEDIKDFIFLHADIDADQSTRFDVGVFTGIMLDYYSNKKRQKGEKAIIHIDGKGSRMDHLFSAVSNIDELVVENFRGDFICSNIASDRGKVDTLIVKDIKGDNCCINLGSTRGNIEKLAAIGIKGKNNLNYFGKSSKIGVMIIMNCYGKLLNDFFEINQKIGLLYLENNRTNALNESNPRSTSYLDTVIALNNTGEWFSSNKAYPSLAYQIGNLFFQNTPIFLKKDHSRENIFDLENISKKGIELYEEKKIEQVIKECRRIDTKDIQSIITGLDEIRQLYLGGKTNEKL